MVTDSDTWEVVWLIAKPNVPARLAPGIRLPVWIVPESWPARPPGRITRIPWPPVTIPVSELDRSTLKPVAAITVWRGPGPLVGRRVVEEPGRGGPPVPSE